MGPVPGNVAGSLDPGQLQIKSVGSRDRGNPDRGNGDGSDRHRCDMSHSLDTDGGNVSERELRSDGIDDVFYDSHSGNCESFRFRTINLGGCWSGNSDRRWVELDLELRELNGPSRHAIDSVQLELWIVGPVDQVVYLRNLSQTLNGWSKEGKGCGRGRIWRG